MRIAKQHGALPNPRDHIYLNIFPRTLDVELRAHSKGMAADLDFKKMSFVLEACGTLHNEQIEQAQSKTASALKKSLASAWELFSTNLESDHLLREKYMASCSGDEARQRAAIIESLEANFDPKKYQILGKVYEEVLFKI